VIEIKALFCFGTALSAFLPIVKGNEMAFLSDSPTLLVTQRKRWIYRGFKEKLKFFLLLFLLRKSRGMKSRGFFFA
jgi:hypothetical protein